MDLLPNLPEFIAAVFLLAMIPGQGTAMILRQTLLFGSRTGAFTVIFYTFGFAIWGALSAIGLAEVFTQSPIAYSALKYVGVSYLLFLSLQGFIHLSKNSSKFDFSMLENVVKATPFRTGITTSLTNAKAALIAVAFLPAFVPRDFNLVLGIFTLGCVWMLTSICWYLPLVLSIGKATDFFANPKSRRALTLISCFGLLIVAFLLAIA
jgi:threonine/homoserine/homoserine lactone efflux protein